MPLCLIFSVTSLVSSYVPCFHFCPLFSFLLHVFSYIPGEGYGGVSEAFWPGVLRHHPDVGRRGHPRTQGYPGCTLHILRVHVPIFHARIKHGHGRLNHSSLKKFFFLKSLLSVVFVGIKFDW